MTKSIPTARDFWFLPLGGCGEIGMNLNLYGHDGQWLMVDCGVSFEASTEQQKNSNDTICADPDFISRQRDKLVGIVITHAHQDHIGAVHHLWPELRCPIFTTPFTAEILRGKLREVGLEHEVPVNVVALDSSLTIGSFSVEWINMTHSIPEPQALLISTKAGSVFHTADWKLDPHPVVGRAYDEARFRLLGTQNVTAMVCDSTNASRPGTSVSEGSLYPGLMEHISQAKGRVIVTCFGSNVARLCTLARIAGETQRRMGLLGRSLETMVGAAQTTGYWPNDYKLYAAADLGFLSAEEVLLVASGSQGDPQSALARLAQGRHPEIELEKGDMVIFSSRVIPGNEDALQSLVDQLIHSGIDVVDAASTEQPIHASGHPSQDELTRLYRWVSPQIAIPVHGDSVLLQANAHVAKSCEVPTQLLGQNGDLFKIAPSASVEKAFAEVGRIKL